MFTIFAEEIQLECDPQQIWSILDACLNSHPFTVHCSTHCHGHTSRNTDNSEMWSHCQSLLITLSMSCVTPHGSKCYEYCRHVTNCVYMFSFVYDNVPLYWSLGTCTRCVCEHLLFLWHILLSHQIYEQLVSEGESEEVAGVIAECLWVRRDEVKAQLARNSCSISHSVLQDYDWRTKVMSTVILQLLQCSCCSSLPHS